MIPEERHIGPQPIEWGRLVKRTTAMAIIEILQFGAQIQRWLDAQVARHLAAQAAKLHR